MNPVLTIRTTAVEAFRFWFYGQNESNQSYNTEEKVIATIKGVYEANIKADYGTACHAIIEDRKRWRANIATDANEFQTIASGSDVMPEHEPIWGYRYGKFSFTDKQAAPLIRYANEHPYMMREIPLSKAYEVNGVTLLITGTTDAIEGCYLRDTKTKFSAVDVQEYMESIQWRLYLDMLGLKHFWYDIFPVKGFEILADVPKSIIEEVQSFCCTVYPEMTSDIHSILFELMDWIKFKNLQEHLAITPPKAKKIVQGNPALKSLITI